MQSKTQATLLGADLSSLNSITDETLFFNTVKFLYCRAYGRDHTGTGDSMTASYVAKARAHNCPVGCYYFGVPFVDAAAGVSTDAQIQANAETQAQQFINKLYTVFGQGNVGDLIPMVDVEQYVDSTTQYGHTATGNSYYPQAVMTNAQLVTWILAFKNYFNSHTGYRVGMYTGEYWIQAPPPTEGIGLTGPQFTSINPSNDYLPLWVSRYDEYNPSNDAVPNFGTWTQYVAWQYTGIGNASAIGVYHANNYVDLNRASDLNMMLATKIAQAPTNVYLGSKIVNKVKLGTALQKINKGTSPLLTIPTWRYIKITMYGDNTGNLFRVVEWEAWNLAGTTNLLAGKMPLSTTNAGFAQANTTAVCTNGDKNTANRFAFMDNTTPTAATCTYDLLSLVSLSNFKMWNYSGPGDQRAMKFKIEVSTDNAVWSTILDLSGNTSIVNNTDGKFPNDINFQ
jgi:GH25 family lysozyme M1 (1,4-beta-N-acetylmuramidase)